MRGDFSYRRTQLTAVCTLLFLSPALRLVPGRSAELAGRGAWLSVLWALPLLLLYALFLRRLGEGRQDGEGLGELILRCLGRRAGTFLLTVLALWFLIYGGFMLRAGAERMISTVYPDASPPVFIVVMAALGLIAALGSERSILRCAKLMAPVVLAVVLPVLIFSSADAESGNLLPLTAYEVLFSMRAAPVTLDVAVLPMVLSLFLGGGRAQAEDSGFLRTALWLLEMLLLLAWIELCILGTFGAELTARLSHPFFTLVRNLVLFESIERPEALVVSLWVFSDFILISVCLSVSQRLLRCCMGKRCGYAGEKPSDLNNGRWIIYLCALFAALVALICAPDQLTLRFWSEKLIPTANLLVAFVLLPLIFIVGKTENAV